MFETPEEMAALQVLLDRSHAAGGPQLSEVVTPDKRLNAYQVVACLKGVKAVAFGTVSAAGEPIVAPLDGVFLHGRFVTSTAGNAVRARHVRRNPAVSLAYVSGVDIGIWVHGRAAPLSAEDAIAQEFDQVMIEAYGASPLSFEGAAIWLVEPRAMFTFAMDARGWPGA